MTFWRISGISLYSLTLSLSLTDDTKPKIEDTLFFSNLIVRVRNGGVDYLCTSNHLIVLSLFCCGAAAATHLKYRDLMTSRRTILSPPWIYRNFTHTTTKHNLLSLWSRQYLKISFCARFFEKSEQYRIERKRRTRSPIHRVWLLFFIKRERVGVFVNFEEDIRWEVEFSWS